MHDTTRFLCAGFLWMSQLRSMQHVCSAGADLHPHYAV